MVKDQIAGVETGQLESYQPTWAVYVTIAQTGQVAKVDHNSCWKRSVRALCTGVIHTSIAGRSTAHNSLQTLDVSFKHGSHHLSHKVAI